MTLHNRVRRLSAIVLASAVVALSTPVFSQEISESHLKAGRAAVAAIHATDLFDSILPKAAAALQQQMIQKNPDLQEAITNIVMQKTMELATRRADLEKESALAYAKVFSEQELNDIANFYNSNSGKKLLENGPAVTNELIKAADIWQTGIARDLGEQVGEALAAAVKAKAPAAPAEGAAAPAEGAAAPAEGDAPANP